MTFRHAAALALVGWFIKVAPSGSAFAARKEYVAIVAKFRSEASSTDARPVLNEVEAANYKLSLGPAGEIVVTPAGILSLRLRTLIGCFADDLRRILRDRTIGEVVA